MKDLLEQYENKRPEIVFEWKDTETEAEGWVVINSLRGGAAGGGTRMRKGLDKHEVESGINFDPADPRKNGVLRRWFKAVTPLLKNYYGTGGDLNIDEVHDVIPITTEYGLLHPQEGVVNGHMKLSKEEKIKRIVQLQIGVSKIIEDANFTPDVSRKYMVADMITGYGVAESVKHYYDIYGGSVKDKKIIIQGWGNVAAAAGYYLAKDGAKIVGIIDRVGGLINENGYTFDEVRTLFLNRKNNTITADHLISYDEINQKIWNVKADVFIPAAASRLVTQQQIESLINAGLQVIACGANVPFADKEIFFGPIGEFADSKISIIPDFISNCGMARTFAYLMTKDAVITDKAIFNDASVTIKNAIEKTHAKNNSPIHIARTSFEIALNNLI
jgi:hypothetical protein